MVLCLCFRFHPSPQHLAAFTWCLALQCLRQSPHQRTQLSKVHRLQDQLAPRAHRTQQVLESQPWQQPESAVPSTSRISQSKAAIAFPLVRRSPSIGCQELGWQLKHHWFDLE
ncbi:hypothetical protein LDENG_00275040 [Lucifuga dentata]|nr:hypothetical protein LDENG_00275040 [Lucifuga dentata]